MTSLPIPLVVLPHGLAAPEQATAGSAGYDLMAAIGDDEACTLAPGSRALLPTGVSIAIPVGMVGLVCSRSGLALKQGVCVLNAPGVIDSDYRGEIGVVLINHGTASVTIQHGDRIAQLIVMACPQVLFQTVETLPESISDQKHVHAARNAGGFGSTGIGARTKD